MKKVNKNLQELIQKLYYSTKKIFQNEVLEKIDNC